MPVRPKLGNAMWLYLHGLAYLAVQQKQEGSYLEVERSLAMLLPCHKCREHYFQNRKTVEYQNFGKFSIIKKLNYLHNCVNVLLEKKIYSLEESIKVSQEINWDQIRIKFFEIVLTLVKYWHKKSWYKCVNLHLRQELLKIVKKSILILNLGAPKQIDLDWTSETIFDDYKKTYQTLELYGIKENEVANGFAYRTGGCECLNK